MSVCCRQHFGRETLASLLKNPNRMNDRSSPSSARDRADRLFGETIQGLTEGLRDAGHGLLLASTGDSMEHEEARLRALRLLEAAQAAGTPVIEIWDHATRSSSSAKGFLISNTVQPVGGPPFTPNRSHKYAGEEAGMLHVPLAGEGRGEGGSNSQGPRCPWRGRHAR